MIQMCLFLFNNQKLICCFFFLIIGNVPEIFLLHLQASLYAFFHRLYGIYPCNFLNFLRKFIRREENKIVYKEIVKVSYCLIYWNIVHIFPLILLLLFITVFYIIKERNQSWRVANELVVSKFKLQSCYYFHFQINTH